MEPGPEPGPGWMRRVERETKVGEDFTITEEAPTRTLSHLRIYEETMIIRCLNVVSGGLHRECKTSRRFISSSSGEQHTGYREVKAGIMVGAKRNSAVDFESISPIKLSFVTNGGLILILREKKTYHNKYK